MERLATAWVIADLIWNGWLESIRVADATFNTETLSTQQQNDINFQVYKLLVKEQLILVYPAMTFLSLFTHLCVVSNL